LGISIYSSLSDQSWCLHSQPHKRELTPVVEDTCAILRLNKLLAMYLDHCELEAFGHLAKRCLAEELLNVDLFINLTLYALD